MVPRVLRPAREPGDAAAGDGGGAHVSWAASDPANVPNYETERDVLRRRRTKIGCWLTLTLVPLGFVLDLAGYPRLWRPLLAGRVACTAIIAVVFWTLATDRLKRHSIGLSWVWGLAPAVMIAWMIYLTEGSVSPFYAGLNLVIIGTAVLLPFSGREAAAYCGSVYAIYAAAVAVHAEVPFRGDVFVMHSTFVLMTGAICATTSHFVERARRADFALREQLRHQNDELKSLDEAKTRFFANVSHELRTPVSLVMAPIDRLLQQRESLSPETRESLVLVRRNAHRLLHLIDDLLELVRFDRPTSRIQTRRIDMSLLTAAMAEAFRYAASERQIELQTSVPDGPAWIDGDEQQLERLVTNLLSNALKYTAAGGRVTVDLAAGGPRVFLTVADTGVGIPAGDLERVFDRFHQSEQRGRRDARGLGIGLALVREIARGHGGEVRVESAPGQGTRFVVELPAAAPAKDRQCVDERLDRQAADSEATGRISSAGEPDTAPDPDCLGTADGSRLRERGVGEVAVATDFRTGPSDGSSPAAEQAFGDVVVVDDEPDMRSFVTSVLSESLSAVAFETAEPALEWIREAESPPRVIVTDLMMPGIDGLEFCRSVRGDPRMQHCKLLMVTARIDDEVKHEALGHGVNDFLTKPFSPTELRTRVANLHAASRLEEGLAARNRELEAALDELRQMRMQLVQQDKLNAIGTLAAGLLHEINNPLNHASMALTYGLDLVRDGDTTSGDPSSSTVSVPRGDLTETLDDIAVALNRVSAIVSDLRSFAYPDAKKSAQSFSVRRALDTAFRFTRAESEGLRFEVEADDDLTAWGVETQVVQVVVNLVLNATAAARERHPGGVGRVRVTARRGDARAELMVRDNGPGIDPSIRDRIFEPFFTTKDVGRGLGLGLSICHSLVAAQGGELSVESEPGQWSEFRVRLPLTENDAAPSEEHAHVGATHTDLR